MIPTSTYQEAVEALGGLRGVIGEWLLGGKIDRINLGLLYDLVREEVPGDAIEETQKCIDLALAYGLVVAGEYIKSEDGGYCFSLISPPEGKKVTEEIMDRWSAQGWQEWPGFICWFENTERGNRWGSLLNA